MKQKLLLALLLALLLSTAPAQAQVIWKGPHEDVEVIANIMQDENWLFLPSGADLTALELEVDGEPLVIDWTVHSSLNEEVTGVYSGILPGSTDALNVIVSENLRSVHLFSDDPISAGRIWLEDCSLHQKSTTGNIVILRADGSIALDTKLEQLRGRGNSSWHKAVFKKPYQFKLEYKMDVLETGIPQERSRTWVLLTNEQDPSMLRNALALDIAKELGLTSSSRCEYVDLYYDGDYRGTYLLAEKIEVGEHSVDIKDFDKLLKPVNKLLRVPDPDDLPSSTQYGTQPPVPAGQTASGLAYGLVEGVYDNLQVDAGGYLLEMQSYGTMSDYSWFKIPGERYVGFSSPEYVGKSMIEHVSGLFMNAHDALMNYGYHPATGVPVEAFLDVDSFTKSMLVSELLMCSTTYSWSSTFFVLPEGERKLYAGPVWDFDRYVSEEWPRLKDNNLFSQAFYRTTVFQRAAKQLLWETIEPMYEEILFGNKRGLYLKSFDEYAKSIRTSWHMNNYRHLSSMEGFLNVSSSYEYIMKDTKDFLQKQYQFLQEEITAWGEDKPTSELELAMLLPYGNAQCKDLIRIVNEPHGSIFLHDTAFALVKEATEEEFATWQVTFTLKAKPRCMIPEDLVVYINGESYTGDIQEDMLTLSFTFEDPSYRPAILDGVDYGYVFDYDYYVESYPELLDMYGDDREAVLRHFRDEGMIYGDVANAFFDPMMVLDTLEYASEKIGTDFPIYYESFMQTPGSWMIELEQTFVPELKQVF